MVYQAMEQDQYNKSNERVKATVVQSRAIISQNDSVIGDTYDPKHQEDHDWSQTSQSCAELEHVPSHGHTRSMHNISQIHKKTIKKILSFSLFDFSELSVI